MSIVLPNYIGVTNYFSCMSTIWFCAYYRVEFIFTLNFGFAQEMGCGGDPGQETFRILFCLFECFLLQPEQAITYWTPKESLKQTSLLFTQRTAQTKHCTHVSSSCSLKHDSYYSIESGRPHLQICVFLFKICY